MKVEKLQDVCLISKGKTITKATSVEGNVPVIGGGLGPTYYHNIANVKAPVITISASGANAGFVNIWVEPIWASDCSTIIEKAGSPALIRYIFKFLQSSQEFINSKLRKGSAQPHVYSSDIGQLRIPLPSINEQKQIVEKLDKAFAEIDSLEKNLQLKEERTNQLLQSILNAAFSNYGYSKNDVFISTIGQLCEIGDGNHSSKYPTKDEMISSGVPFIRAKNLIHDDVDATDLIYISKHKHEDLLKGHIKKGDILLTNRGEIGKLAIVPAKFDGSNLNAQIAWLRCSDKIINRYLFLYLKSDLAKKLFISGTRGSALQQLTIGKLKSIEVPVLGLKNQQMIIDKLDKVFAEIDKLKAQTSIQKKSANALRQSILSRAFNLDDKVA
jgi:restriction endonuclease S subunit